MTFGTASSAMSWPVMPHWSSLSRDFLSIKKEACLIRLLENPGPQGSLFPFFTGLLLNFLGQAAGIFYLSQVSIPLTLYGMGSYLAGRTFSRELLFPLLFLLLAFPIPGKSIWSWYSRSNCWLRKASGTILHLIGYPVKVRGNIIEISSISLGVVDACSGLNSLMAILTLSIFYSRLTIGRWFYRLIIVASMVPLIMVANIMRVTITAVLAVRWSPEMLEGKLHWLWGAAVFAMAVCGLIAITEAFAAIEKRRTARAG